MPDHPLNRASDQNTLAKLNAKASEYRIFIWMAIGVALALGFKYTTPGARMDTFEAKLNMQQRQLDSLVKVTTGQAENIKSVSLLQCFNPTYTNGQLRLVGIDCTGIR